MNIDDINGHLTPEQLDELLEGEEIEEGNGEAELESKETGKTPDTEVKAAPQGEEAIKAAADGIPPEGEIDPAKAVIIGKDGKYHIPYEKLVEAREQEKAAKSKAAETLAELSKAQQLLAELQAQAEARKASGTAPTATDNQLEAARQAIEDGIDPDVFGDFSEEALKKGILAVVEKQVEQRVSARVAEVLEKNLKPIQQEQAKRAANEHESAIYAKHEDADSIVESKEFGDWVALQPSYAKSAIVSVLKEGSSAQVIELFDRFKAENSPAQAAAPDDASLKAKALAAVNKIEAGVPNSLSDIPGGKPGATGTIGERIKEMDGPGMLAAMNDMSAEQIEALLN
jgi:chemotaxis protein histidine kinase CheA